jgi:hypothetical protein
VYLKKIFRGHSPRTPRGEGGERKGREGRRKGGDKGKEEKGGRERRKQGKGIRVGREGIGPPQCLTQIDAPGTRDCNPGIRDLFLNPEIPGLDGSNPGISGLTTSYISI